ncbi:MAG: hypothetical protein HZB46_02550 [Solirubrobacterales bacterium]|nr:hypothetical protein [Solirubrobacterales bacterium]
MNAFAVDQTASVRWSLPDRFQLRHAGLTVTSPDLPAWVRPFVERLNQLIVGASADPRGHQPLNLDDLRDAVDFLLRVMQPDTVQPWVGLLASGGLQINWRQGDVEVEAIFDRARDEQVVYLTVGENEWEEPLHSAYSLFGLVADRLSTTGREQPAVLA